MLRAKKTVKVLIIVTVMTLTALLFAAGRYMGNKGERFLKNLTLQSAGQCFDVSAKKDDGNVSYSAWTQCRKETLQSEFGRSCDADVIAIYGDSGCVFPIGANLPAEDTEGCIIGEKLAEDLFGSGHAAGGKLFWREQEWTVRRVVEEPAELCLLQASGMKEQPEFERISITVKEGDNRRKVFEEFTLNQGLSAHALRWDYLYGAKWLLEMLPSDWSDFDGWKKNLQEWSRAVKLAKTAERSAIEEAGLNYRKRALFCHISGIICVITGLVIMWRTGTKKNADKEGKSDSHVR